MGINRRQTLMNQAAEAGHADELLKELDAYMVMSEDWRENYRAMIMHQDATIKKLLAALQRIASMSPAEAPVVAGVSAHESCWQTMRLTAREAVGITT